MKYIFIFIIAIVGFSSCHDMKVGYLDAINVEYDPDSLVVRFPLDPVLDANRIANPYPWISSQLQGVQGTLPIHYEIVGINVLGKEGDATKLQNHINIRGGGLIQVDENVDLPKGRYGIDVRIYNQDHEHSHKNIFTVIVE